MPALDDCMKNLNDDTRLAFDRHCGFCHFGDKSYLGGAAGINEQWLIKKAKSLEVLLRQIHILLRDLDSPSMRRL